MIGNGEIYRIYSGALHIEIIYIVELLGDLPRYLNFNMIRAGSFDEALALAEKWAPNPDPEDDRILIWEVLPSGHKKVIWHFSGWHWIQDEFGEQGKYKGHEKSLYEECMERY
jgi:hypothetical protein